jgi:hypothetical protein
MRAGSPIRPVFQERGDRLFQNFVDGRAGGDASDDRGDEDDRSRQGKHGAGLGHHRDRHHS